MDGQTLTKALQEATARKIQNYPCNNVRASEIGHPCERYNVLSITNWEDKMPYDVSLQNIFDLGNAIEAEAIRRVKEAGFEVLTGSRNFKINKPMISGREDIMLKDPETGELYPCEIKGLAPNTYDSINSIGDMLHHRRYYVRKYPAQLQIYMLNFNKEKGYFLIFNKVSGAIKVIEAFLDYEYAEGLLKKAERVYGHISAGTLPETIVEADICGDCPLVHICGTHIDHGEAKIDTGELEDLLQRSDALKPYVKEYDDLKEQIKSAVGGADKVFTASYILENKTVTRKAYTVPESEYRRQVVRKVKY